MADLKKVHFSKSPILKIFLWKFHGSVLFDFFFQEFFFFALFTWKLVIVYWLARMAQNFDQAKRDNTIWTTPNILGGSVPQCVHFKGGKLFLHFRFPGFARGICISWQWAQRCIATIGASKLSTPIEVRLPETTIGKDAKNQNELGFPTMQLFGIKGQRDKLKILPRAGTGWDGPGQPNSRTGQAGTAKIRNRTWNKTGQSRKGCSKTVSGCSKTEKDVLEQKRIF